MTRAAAAVAPPGSVTVPLTLPAGGDAVLVHRAPDGSVISVPVRPGAISAAAPASLQSVLEQAYRTGRSDEDEDDDDSMW